MLIQDNKIFNIARLYFSYKIQNLLYPIFINTFFIYCNFTCPNFNAVWDLRMLALLRMRNSSTEKILQANVNIVGDITLFVCCYILCNNKLTWTISQSERFVFQFLQQKLDNSNTNSFHFFNQLVVIVILIVTLTSLLLLVKSITISNALADTPAV